MNDYSESQANMMNIYVRKKDTSMKEDDVKLHEDS